MEFDLDSFIADIEQTAPLEPTDDNNIPTCPDCDRPLVEDNEGRYSCPECGAQANIVQLQDTELHYDELGRPMAIFGQRAEQKKKKRSYLVDYGWAWSTDDAIVHILDAQVTALEKCGLVPDSFREGIKNMWLKFWVENIGPFVRDEYNEGDLIPLEAFRKLKLRDIEVLIKVKDKVVVPKPTTQSRKTKTYQMLGYTFYKSKTNDDQGTSGDIAPSQSSNSSDIVPDTDEIEDVEMAPEPEVVRPANLKSDAGEGVTVLTLNRTLAFIVAVSHCLNLPEPLFAADIIRFCNQRLIPYFGAHKILPEGMKFNRIDKMMFQKNRAPSPDHLISSASHLIQKVYHDLLPMRIPVPNLGKILQRLVTDMNLPNDLMNHMTLVDFDCINRTKPVEFRSGGIKARCLPHYDRWAFAILIAHMKKLYTLDDQSILEQKEEAKNGERIFVIVDWARQMTLRLRVVINYDPFMLFHPLVDVANLQPTPQVFNYVKTIMDDRITATTRLQDYTKRQDENVLNEMADFLNRHVPKPKDSVRSWLNEDHLEAPIHPISPIRDALERTRRFWSPEISRDKENLDLIERDFSQDIVRPFKTTRLWSIYDQGVLHVKQMSVKSIQPNWPFYFRMLLHVGAYWCYCEPRELLIQYKFVEEYLYPRLRVLRKTRKHGQGDLEGE